MHLTPLAEEIASRFHAEFPDDVDRYGASAREWCIHDNRWLLGWAAESLELGARHLHDNVRWLAGILRARNYPTDRLKRDLEIAADVVGEAPADRGKLAERLRRAAALLR